MKRFVSFLLLFAMLISMSLTANADDEITVTVDGVAVEFDAKPFIENDRVLVPMRAVFEAMGAYVTWYEDKREVWITRNMPNKIVKYLWIGIDDNHLYWYDQSVLLSNKGSRGDGNIELDVSATIHEDRTYVPLRAISEAFDYNVDWDGENRTVIIAKKPTVTPDDLVHRLLAAMPQDENYAVSLSGLKASLIMLSKGTDEETTQEILNALDFEDMEHADKLYDWLVPALDNNQNISFKTELTLNHNEGWEPQLSENFINSVLPKYNAAVREGNSEENTFDINTELSFVKPWDTHKIFDEADIYTGIFTDIDGNEVETEFMYAEDSFRYYEYDDTQILQIHMGGSMSVYFILGDLNRLGSINYTEGEQVRVAIPKFVIDYAADYSDVLKSMGINRIFDSANSDFSAMLDNSADDITLGKVIQNNRLEISEKGIRLSSDDEIADVPEKSYITLGVRKEFIADRPFTFVIDYSDRLILGRYVRVE